MSEEFRLKNIDEIRNSFLPEIEQNKWMSRKHKKICTTLNYILDVFQFLLLLLCLIFTKELRVPQ